MAQCAYNCLLYQHYTIFNDTNSIRTLKDTTARLKRKNRRRGVNAFLSTLKSFPAGFRTSTGIAGNQLLQLDNVGHQNGLVTMAHAYLCLSGHGRIHWPAGSNDGTLEYPRDENELYYNIICYFIRKNITDSGSKLRSRRPRDEEADLVPIPRQRRRLISSLTESPSPSPPLSLTPSPTPPLYDSSSDESESPPPSSQDSHSTSTSVQEEARQEVYEIVFRANESPDELAQDYNDLQPTVPNVQQRHVNRIGDEHGNISRISLDQQPTPRAPRPNLHSRNISTGTQTTFGVDQQRQWMAPLPSSLDTDNNSQQRHNPVSDQANEAEEPASQSSVEDIPRTFGTPLTHPRRVIPERDFKIELVVSYDVIPGFNFPLQPIGDIFSYSLDKFLSQVNWQHEPEVLLICLKAPGGSPVTPVRTWMDMVFKNDEDKFQSVLRRFRQIFLDEQSNFTRMKMDAVIEIVFENMIEGHTHSVLINTWFNRGRAAGGKV